MAELTEMDYYAALGIEPKQPDAASPGQGSDSSANGGGDKAGEKEQEVAEPHDTNDTTGGGPEAFEDEDDSTETPPQLPAGDSSIQEGAGAAVEDKKPQSKEERAKFAAARRKAETDAAVEAALKAEREKLTALIKRAGLKNPDGQGAEVDSLDGLEKYVNAQDDAEFQRKLKTGKLTREDIAAAAAVAGQKPGTDAAEQKNAGAGDPDGFEDKVRRELGQIHELDETVVSTADLKKMPDFAQFKAYVEGGKSFYQAFVQLTKDRAKASADALAVETAKKAQQQALNLARSKEHLTKTDQRGAGAVQVPKDVAEMYRAFNPDMSDADMQKNYQKYINDTRK